VSVHDALAAHMASPGPMQALCTALHHPVPLMRRPLLQSTATHRCVCCGAQSDLPTSGVAPPAAPDSGLPPSRQDEDPALQAILQRAVSVLMWGMDACIAPSGGLPAHTHTPRDLAHTAFVPCSHTQSNVTNLESARDLIAEDSSCSAQGSVSGATASPSASAASPPAPFRGDDADTARRPPPMPSSSPPSASPAGQPSTTAASSGAVQHAAAAAAGGGAASGRAGAAVLRARPRVDTALGASPWAPPPPGAQPSAAKSGSPPPPPRAARTSSPPTTDAPTAAPAAFGRPPGSRSSAGPGAGGGGRGGGGAPAASSGAARPSVAAAFATSAAADAAARLSAAAASPATSAAAASTREAAPAWAASLFRRSGGGSGSRWVAMACRFHCPCAHATTQPYGGAAVSSGSRQIGAAPPARHDDLAPEPSTAQHPCRHPRTQWLQWRGCASAAGSAPWAARAGPRLCRALAGAPLGGPVCAGARLSGVPKGVPKVPGGLCCLCCLSVLPSAAPSALEPVVQVRHSLILSAR
jgi:hypothetical protein